MTQTPLSIEYLPLTYLLFNPRGILLSAFSGRGTAVIVASAQVLILTALNSARTTLRRFCAAGERSWGIASFWIRADVSSTTPKVERRRMTKSSRRHEGYEPDPTSVSIRR